MIIIVIETRLFYQQYKGCGKKKEEMYDKFKAGSQIYTAIIFVMFFIEII